ncbi:MAG: class I SAM-dependent methyltransferase [Polyangiaceae bacterium]|nr:class I SAM-dependent methyltransferase [Polyangiaceae bacterium]
MDIKTHWDNVYTTKLPTQVSWFQPHAARSLEIIQKTGVVKTASIVDVGGGASTLVDDLLANGYTRLTVLDISGPALQAAQARLGESASKVKWVEANVLEAPFEVGEFDVWHDRAVFHFLTSAQDRTAYVQKVLAAVKPGGFVIVATFAGDGPEKCSGLPVQRYEPNELHSEFGNTFELMGHERETHTTPAGGAQKFVYCFCRRG